jgi:uncharacterized protein (TIGR00369 family)
MQRVPIPDDPAAQRERDWFSQVPLHKVLGIELVEMGDAFAVFSMPVAEGAFNSTGNLHGGAIATLIDIASGAAAALGSGFKPGQQTLVTADLHVRYLGRPHGDVIYARGDVLRAGRQLTIVETRVTDDSGRIIATADFASMIVPLRGPLKPTPTARNTDPDV